MPLGPFLQGPSLFYADDPPPHGHLEPPPLRHLALVCGGYCEEGGKEGLMGNRSPSPFLPLFMCVCSVLFLLFPPCVPAGNLFLPRPTNEPSIPAGGPNFLPSFSLWRIRSWQASSEGARNNGRKGAGGRRKSPSLARV